MYRVVLVFLIYNHTYIRNYRAKDCFSILHLQLFPHLKLYSSELFCYFHLFWYFKLKSHKFASFAQGVLKIHNFIILKIHSVFCNQSLVMGMKLCEPQCTVTLLKQLSYFKNTQYVLWSEFSCPMTQSPIT